MMTDVDRQIRRTTELLQRTSARQLRRRAKSAVSRARRATRYAMIGMGAVLVAAIVWGMFAPLGITGILIVMLAMMSALVLGVMFSAEPAVPAESLREIDLKLLPARTDRWLDTQRPMLPPPAQTLADMIGQRLEILEPQLATLDPREPVAGEVRKVLGEHLTELVGGYVRVPPPMRRERRDGMLSPDEQLVQGLRIIDEEIDEISRNIAAGDLKTLATQEKFLQLKYRGIDSDPA